MPARAFPTQTLAYFRFHRTQMAAASVCEALGLDRHGTRSTLVRRVLRHVHGVELWLPRLETPSAPAIRVLAKLYPIFARSKESNYCEEFEEEINDIWPSRVHAQYPIAHGRTLRIDFHVGDPGADGVGLEFKYPRSNADVQRAIGQLGQYLAAYPATSLVFVVLDDGSLSRAQLFLLAKEVKERGIAVVRRSV
jgi:hypothetical protein